MTPMKLEYGRYVTNKLWNLFRFYINYASDLSGEIPVACPEKESLSIVEQYIVNKSEMIAREIERNMNELNVELSCQTSVTYLLNTVCDLYDSLILLTIALLSIVSLD